MASIVRSGKKYYIQFFDNHKSPNRKQVPTETRSITTARKVAKRLEADYLLGNYDPWHLEKSEPRQIQTLGELITLYVEEKSKTDWNSNTTLTNGKLFGKISREIGHQKLDELTEFPFDELINDHKKAYATRLGYRAKFTAFLNWAFLHDYLQKDKFHVLKLTQTESDQISSINYFTPNDIKILTSYISGKVVEDLEKGFQKKNSNALWLVDFINWQRLSGMRLSETLNLRKGDINTETWEITIGNDHFVTKSKKKQILPIESVEQLKDITKKKLADCSSDEDRLFGHSCRRHTNRIFNKYLKGALPKKTYLNIHSLRHTCCIELLRAGVPIYTVQRWLRHADVKTTQRYADLLNMDISEQVGRALK